MAWIEYCRWFFSVAIFKMATFSPTNFRILVSMKLCLYIKHSILIWIVMNLFQITTDKMADRWANLFNYKRYSESISLYQPAVELILYPTTWAWYLWFPVKKKELVCMSVHPLKMVTWEWKDRFKWNFLLQSNLP